MSAAGPQASTFNVDPNVTSNPSISGEEDPYDIVAVLTFSSKDANYNCSFAPSAFNDHAIATTATSTIAFHNFIIIDIPFGSLDIKLSQIHVVSLIQGPKHIELVTIVTVRTVSPTPKYAVYLP